MTHIYKALRLCAVMVAAGIISISMIAPVAAQQTTAELNGRVIDAAGSPSTGASIEIIHVGSGARWTTSTSESGTFLQSGLRPGGPYTVTVVGTDIREEGVYLNISTPTSVYLAPEAPTEEIVVVGSQIQTGLRMGAATMISEQQLDEAASIARDFKNVIRTDPRLTLDPTNSNAISIGGVNARLNSLTVDGVRQNDEFGLNQSGFPTQRSPISVDAIQQISVETAPFSVEYGGFQGGTINIVTKSGENDFHGSILYNRASDSLIGDKSKDRDINIGVFEEEFLSATFSGPIIKDRLWFFASYEKFEGSDPDAIQNGVEGSGRAVEIQGVTQADVDQIRNISQTVYGYDPLDLFQNATQVEDEKILAKLDWRINDFHNAILTYQFVDGNDLVDQGTSSGSDRLGLPSNFYNRGEEMTAYSVQIFSDWTDAFSTEVKIAFKDIDNLQAPLGGNEFAQMTVDLASGSSIRFGPDVFRHENFLITENSQIKLKADYSWREHLFSFGYERDNVDVFNAFSPTSRGDYEFASVADFQNRLASSVFMANVSATGDVTDLSGRFDQTIDSFYIEDRWDIRDNLTITAGLRMDTYSSDDAPIRNDNFVARNGFANTETMDGRDIVMPRIGFNWQPLDRTTIRGGVGLFSGGVPTGFVSNSFSNVGIINQSGFFGSTAMAGILVDGFNIDPSLLAQLQPGDGDVAAIDPDFDIPSIWKINIAWDQQFDIGSLEDFNFTADLIFGFVQDAPVWKDLRREVIGTAADGRPIYGAVGCANDPATVDPIAECRDILNYDVLMTNTGEGTNHSFSFSLDKNWDLGRGGELSTAIAYTNQRSRTVSDALSSTPTSLIGREQTFDRNNSLLGRSSFETEHRGILTATWRKTFFDNLPTTASIFIQRQSGKPYGYTFNAPRNALGDTFGGNEPIDDDDTQLLYVPTGASDPNVIYAAGFDLAAFDALVDSTPCLSKYRGQIVPQNACTSSYTTRMDMRFTQAIRLNSVPFLGESGFTLYLDIENLGNLLNDDWGRVQQISFPFTAEAVTLDQDLGPNNELIFDSYRSQSQSVSNTASLWKVQLGASFSF
jgi:outer membrane receptor for ferrienterochelin and colicin